MDTFLTQLYDEEMEKTAGSEMDEFMMTLPKEELEDFLFAKEAVAGPAEPPMPTAAQGMELDAKQKEKQQQSDKENLQEPRKRKEETTNSHEGKAKQAMVDYLSAAIKEKRASSCKTTAFTTPEAKMKAAINIQKMKAGKVKQSEGDGEEMETTASVKAKIASRALRSTSGAPEYIKQAAIVFAGGEFAKEAGVLTRFANKANLKGVSMDAPGIKGILKRLGSGVKEQGIASTAGKAGAEVVGKNILPKVTKSLGRAGRGAEVVGKNILPKVTKSLGRAGRAAERGAGRLSKRLTDYSSR